MASAMPPSHEFDPGPAGEQRSERWLNPVRSESSQYTSKRNQPRRRRSRQNQDVRKSPRIPERRTNHLTRKFVDEMSQKAKSPGELISGTPGINLEDRVHRRKSETVASARESKGGLSEQLNPAHDSWKGMASALPQSGQFDSGPAGNQ